MHSKPPINRLSPSSCIHFLFNVAIFLYFTVISCSYNGENESDHHALMNIKLMITQDPYGSLTSWNKSLHFCDWSGVTCGKRHRRVTSLRLGSKGLQGSLSPHVGNLSFLRELLLFNNKFQRVVPHELGRLHRLRLLALEQNKFSGFIPTNLSSCLNLEVLDLSKNELVGRIPKEISFLSKLTFLSLGDNKKLTGEISPFLGNLTSLELFSIVETNVGGSIPDTIGQWKNLKEIYCGACNLSGTIPHSLYNLSYLTNFSMPANQLTGNLPLAIGAMLPHLVIIELSGNQLTGPLPPSISNCSRLRYLQLSENSFSGRLEIEFQKLTELRRIHLGDISFVADEMKFVDSIKNCTRLVVLMLNNCNLQGVLPKSIGNLSNQLSYIYLEENQLYGNLPSSIANLAGLNRLHLYKNQFTGNIPSSIGNLQKVTAFYLEENQFSGQIPHTIGNLSSLISLSLYSNLLEGVIPSSIGSCHGLLELYLRDNKLNGTIPTQLLQLSSLSIMLDLSQNNFFGSLPQEVGDLKMLSYLDLSYNNFSGDIPSSLSGCVSLSWLSLKNNFFQGMIPPSLEYLKGLTSLDISHNSLSGRIPQFLANLEYLNLSYNDFEGKVPMLGVFTNTSVLSVLGNRRLCGGIIELGLPKCKETTKHKKRVPLFGKLILIATTFLILISFAFAWCKKKRKNRPSQSLMKDRFFKVSYDQLLKATNGFSEANLIGIGGFSSVYKGNLYEDDDKVVAVKVLHLQNRGAQRSFMRECDAWRSIRHRNLLRIITACSSIDFQGNDFKALIYEYMLKGSLHDWLHSYEAASRLNFLQITNILVDVASALDYIHNRCQPNVVHGDLKPSNILLDDDMVAHVGDFGLARFLGTSSYQNSSTGIRGTIGYAAPEYGLGSEMTVSGDVYSFGILLLEMMTRKKPTDDIFNENLSLHKFASIALPDHVINVIDINILNIYQEMSGFNEAQAMKVEGCLSSIIKIGVSCSMDTPSQRMNMEDVVNELRHILITLQNIEV